MRQEIIVTEDGSHSIAIPEMGVTYHSTHGALQESMHVFIASGYRFITEKLKTPALVSIFEMGFGTGLNALLTLIEAEKNQQPVYFETIEAFPLDAAIANLLNYSALLQRPDLQTAFEQLHNCGWNTVVAVSPFFRFKKINTSLANYMSGHCFDAVYYDAFAPDSQPELWTEDIFRKLYGQVRPGGVLTTYCSKSVVRRAMAAAGWQVEKIPGPPHKREMVRALVPLYAYAL